MRAEHLDFLQSPWFIELGAFYLNLDGPDGGGEIKELLFYFSCDLNATPPIMTMTLSDSTKLDYDLTCAVCLVRSLFSRKDEKIKIRRCFILVFDF